MYVIGIDQSTQGTKALLLDGRGRVLRRCDRPHRQIVNERGWVSHDPAEILRNTLAVCREVTEGIDRAQVAAIGISNQRETALAWDRRSGAPVCDAVVWQCARAAALCGRLADAGETVRQKTGLPLSPYFTAAKLAWILEAVPGARRLAQDGMLCCGTMDGWLVYNLTGQFRTDYSNASRTQLLNLETLRWDAELCTVFGIPELCLPELTDSDGLFGCTTLGGLLPAPVPVHGVLGDSHAALFGQGCRRPGMLKATYGTGSSVMMNVGDARIRSQGGLASSLAWRMRGRAQYVLEGNINYTGAVLTWLRDQVGLISGPAEAEPLARSANPADGTYLVPAFSGLGAPYWRSDVSAAFFGMGRTTGRAELVKAALDSIAYQITDIVRLMQRDAGITDISLRVDGGPTRNGYLMQLQSDLLNCPVRVPAAEELSAIGAAWAAGLGADCYDADALDALQYTSFEPVMPARERERKYTGWQAAVAAVCGKEQL